jgi:hypothetical protein
LSRGRRAPRTQEASGGTEKENEKREEIHEIRKMMSLIIQKHFPERDGHGDPNAWYLGKNGRPPL